MNVDIRNTLGLLVHAHVKEECLASLFVFVKTLVYNKCLYRVAEGAHAETIHVDLLHHELLDHVKKETAISLASELLVNKLVGFLFIRINNSLS